VECENAALEQSAEPDVAGDGQVTSAMKRKSRHLFIREVRGPSPICLILKRFERSEAIERLERLEQRVISPRAFRVSVLNTLSE
jgi:hypothetical protein